MLEEKRLPMERVYGYVISAVVVRIVVPPGIPNRVLTI